MTLGDSKVISKGSPFGHQMVNKWTPSGKDDKETRTYLVAFINHIESWLIMMKTDDPVCSSVSFLSSQKMESALQY